jgi:hypothetical protein
MLNPRIGQVFRFMVIDHFGDRDVLSGYKIQNYGLLLRQRLFAHPLAPFPVRRGQNPEN